MQTVDYIQAIQLARSDLPFHFDCTIFQAEAVEGMCRDNAVGFSTGNGSGCAQESRQ
jgi:hypothetical protein